MQNAKTEGAKKKPQLQLVPPALMEGAARGYAEGERLYGPFDWRNTGVSYMEYMGAILRHAEACLRGEDVDPDGDGKTHWDGIAAGVGILMDAKEHGVLKDDRPTIRHSLVPAAEPNVTAASGVAKRWADLQRRQFETLRRLAEAGAARYL